MLNVAATQLDRYLDELADAETWTYRGSIEAATEPAAWAAMALAAHGRTSAALRPARWLAEVQQDNGSVGVSATQQEPSWPTSLALLSWSMLRHAAGREFETPIRLGRTWALASAGKSAPRSEHVGHDTELVGWSWAPATHSWLEPTCLFVLGLRATGDGQHARVREGVRLIVDRLLPQGAANYGNTIVLGQALVPHVQPTGLAMLALGGERVADPRVDKSLGYLQESIGPQTSPPSLALGCLGLAAHGRRLPQCEQWAVHALASKRSRPLAAYEKSLLLLAAASTLQLSAIGLAPREAA